MWILILIITGLTEGGGGVDHVEFKTQQGCLEAISQLPTDSQIYASFGRKSLYAVCVEKK
jgi:hypothetical protein